MVTLALVPHPSGMGRSIRRKMQNLWVGIKQFNRTTKGEEYNNNNTDKKNIQHAMFSPPYTQLPPE